MNTENQTELVVVKDLQPELTTIVKSSKMDLNKAEMYAIGYAPLMNEIIEQNNIIKGLDKLKPEDAAVAKRASLDLGKIISRATDKKKADKEVLLIETRHVDNLFNLLESTGILGQADAKEIFTYAEKIEADRLNKVYNDRVLLLEPYGEVNRFIDLKQMDEVTFNNFLADTKLAYETRKENERKAEQERIDAEKKAEQDRIDYEKKAELERLEKEKADKLERERIEKENAELKEKELIRQKRFNEMQPIAIVIRDFNAMIELPEREYQKALVDHKIGFQQHIEFKYEQENKERELEAKKRQDELAQIEKNAQIKAKENAEKELKEKEKARIKAEEAEKLAKEKALANAGDKEKIKEWFPKYVELLESFPQLTSVEGKELQGRAIEALLIVKKLIATDAKKLV